MLNITDLVRLIKKTAIDAVNATDPVAIRYGEVISINPLQIRIDQKLVLGKEQLKLTKTVVDKPLIKDEKLLIIRMQGGQQYIVVDRV